MFSKKNFSMIAQLLCQHPLTETDGAVFITPSQKYDFNWLFYNNDGSEAEMCGNAARCATLFAHDEDIVKNHCEFETLAGTIIGEVISKKEVRVRMPQLKDINMAQVINDDRVFTKYDFVDSGVPHCVIKVNSFENLEEHRPLAEQLRKPKYFKPKGANITFRVPINKEHIESVTFERGVEDFTEACGTGAVAAAYAHINENKNISRVQVSVPGGELYVEFKENFPYLGGAVNYLGEIQLEELKGAKEDE